MSALDQRTRPARRIREIVPEDFFAREAPERLREHAACAARAVARSALPPLAFEIDGRSWTIVPGERGLTIEEGARDDGLLARLDAGAFSALMDDHKSTLGLSIAGRVELVRGSGDRFVAWEPVLRAAFDGRAAFVPGSVRLEDAEGRPLDLSRRFGLDDPASEMREFLRAAGFLGLRSVFTEAEMAAVRADLDRAEAAARPDDGTSWWVRTRTGEHRPSRILNFFQQSKAFREIARDPRFLSLGAIADEGHVHADSFGEHFADPTAEGLIKPVGVTDGIADLGWHKDCARGGHSRFCCGLTVGIALTPADEESGELRVVAGSHRANVVGAGLEPDVDLPIVALPAMPGDVSIHCSCTLHEALPPRTRERRVVYTGFVLPPRFADDAPTDRATLERERADIGRIG